MAGPSWWNPHWWATPDVSVAVPLVLGPPASLTAAASAALVSIGDAPITALDEDNDRARAVLTFAQILLDELLREHDWNFASYRVALVRLVAAPAFGYTAHFALPTEPQCLMVRETDLDPEEAYAVEQVASGQRVLACNTTTVGIRYTARVLDSSVWDPLFRMGYINRLAAELAYPITSKAAFATGLWQKCEQRLRRAKGVDGLEGRRKKSFTSDALTRVR